MLNSETNIITHTEQAGQRQCHISAPRDSKIICPKHARFGDGKFVYADEMLVEHPRGVRIQLRFGILFEVSLYRNLKVIVI